LIDILKRDQLPLEDRRAAADGLRKRADPATRSAIFDALRRQQDKLLRTSLIQTLGQVGTAADIPALKDVAAKSPELRERVEGAIEDIQARGR